MRLACRRPANRFTLFETPSAPGEGHLKEGETVSWATADSNELDGLSERVRQVSQKVRDTTPEAREVQV